MRRREQVTNVPGEIELFWKDDLASFLAERKRAVKIKINSFVEDDFANASNSELLMTIKNEFEVSAPIFDTENIEFIKEGTVRIDFTGDQRFHQFDDDDGKRVMHDVPFFDLAIKFSGTRELLLYRPQHSMTPPVHARIDANEIVVRHQDLDIKGSIEDFTRQLIAYLKHSSLSTKNETDKFNSWLESEGAKLLGERSDSLNLRQKTFADIGIKIRKRETPPNNINKPIIRKSITAVDRTREEPKSGAEALDIDVYDEILEICTNMAKVMEFSPSAFHSIGEEDLRFHFLVQLNGVFKGQATGETFNVGGKTDIIIKQQNENIFIAECKYWNGEKKHVETIDQLLGYVSWRDTKTAIIIFNRLKDFGGVLKKLRTSTSNHSACIKEEPDYKSETGFRYRFKHPQQNDKEILLTVLAFNIPNKDE